MRILVSWLREYVTFDVGVQGLADALTMRGLEVSAIEPPPPGVGGTGEDAVLDLEITPNRPDCLSVFGIAREVSTIYDTPLRAPDRGGNSNTGGESAVEVTLEDAGLCPRYAASVANVTVGPSPGWLATRLDAAGIRPINNVVDATNYVMLELGHPTHAFDLDRLDSRALRIRRAVTGEKVRTLDGLERTLQTDMLVIADASRPQAVAGVMGSADSEVSGGTRVVAIESAYFEPTSVRRTSKRLGLSTDASYRFERGADIDAPVAALRRVHTLLAQIGAAQPDGPIIDRYPEAREPRVVELWHPRIARVLGIDIDEGFVVTTLERLGFAVQPADAPHEDMRWRVTVPTHRIDVSREIDLIEEVARHHGYDRLPSTFPALVQAPAPTGRWLKRQRLLCRILTASGCSEAITYSFIEQEAAAPFATDSGDANAGTDIVTIANPLSEKFAVLRPSLLPGLIDSLIRNRRREHQDVRLFEIGKRFSHRNGETAAVALAVTGAGAPEHWSATDREVDLFDVKGIVERLCDALGVTPTFAPTQPRVLVPGRGATVRGTTPDGHVIELGHLGQFSPSLAIDRGLPAAGGAIYVAELDLDALSEVAVDRDALHAAPVPRYPSIVRDVAIVVAASLPAGAVRGTIQAAAPDTLVSVREFDRYQGKGVPEGCVSLALRLTFRASDRTLTDAEVQTTMDAVVKHLEQQHDATLR